MLLNQHFLALLMNITYALIYALLPKDQSQQRGMASGALLHIAAPE